MLRFIYAYGILALVSVVAVSYGMFYLYGTAQQICVVDTDSVATVCNYVWLMFNNYSSIKNDYPRHFTTSVAKQQNHFKLSMVITTIPHVYLVVGRPLAPIQYRGTHAVIS